MTVHAPGGGKVPYTFRFVATDSGIAATDVPPTQIITDGSMVAWRNNQEILVQEGIGDTTVLTVRGVRSGSRTVLAELGEARVSSVATALIGTAGSRPAGDPDFGPWPTWLVIAIAIVTAIVVGAALLVLLVLRRIRRRLSPGGPA